MQTLYINNSLEERFNLDIPLLGVELLPLVQVVYIALEHIEVYRDVTSIVVIVLGLLVLLINWKLDRATRPKKNCLMF
jgi:hypothetical protein